MEIPPSNKILDEVLNTISNLPLDIHHFNKQLLILKKDLLKATKRLQHYYKKILKHPHDSNFAQKIIKYEERATSIHDERILVVENLNKIIQKMKNVVQQKLYPHRIEYEMEVSCPNVEPEIKGIENDALYCICKENSHGDMVCCDSQKCEIGWFHFACVGLKSAPKGHWFCDTCKKKRKTVK